MTTLERRDGPAVSDEIRLGDFFPEQRYVVVSGQRHLAWVTTNKRYPRPIMARLDRAHNKWSQVAAPLMADVLTPEQLAQLSDAEREQYERDRDRAIADHNIAWQEYLTDALMLLIPTLDETTASIVDEQAANDLLIELGYFDGAPHEEPATRESNEASPLTGDISTPESPDSIQPTQ